jgi:hypothetical protein
VNVAVIGGGVAGTAAAWMLARSGIDVTLLADRAGASALYSGALDKSDWTTTHELWQPDSDAEALIKALGIWQIGPKESRVATSQGLVRNARGRDTAILDLEEVAGRRIALADVERDDWDARLLAKHLAASDWATRTQTRFEAVTLPILGSGHERRLGLYDFARLFDDPVRIQGVAEKLKAATDGFDAWLFGPWLGVEKSAAVELRAQTGKLLGETTSGLGGPSGTRFELARDRLLSALKVKQVRARVTSFETHGDQYRLKLDAAPDSEPFAAIVLAIGGVAAAGIELEAFSRRGGANFKTSLGVEIPISLDGSMLDGVPSLWGFDFSKHGLGALERVGITALAHKVPGFRDLYAAGDCVAGRPRTVLEAVTSGILAARAIIAK